MLCNIIIDTCQFIYFNQFYLSSDNIGLWLRYPLNIETIGNENTGLNINSLGEDENGELYVLNKKLPDRRVRAGLFIEL